MTDVRTYTRDNTPPWAARISAAIAAGDLDDARTQFRQAQARYGADHTIYAAAATGEPSPGQITVGASAVLFGNPFRPGFAWRCGECLAAFRRGGPDPRSGVGYRTVRGAAGVARKHAAEGHAGRVAVSEVTRP